MKRTLFGIVITLVLATASAFAQEPAALAPATAASAQTQPPPTTAPMPLQVPPVGYWGWDPNTAARQAIAQARTADEANAAVAAVALAARTVYSAPLMPYSPYGGNIGVVGYGNYGGGYGYGGGYPLWMKGCIGGPSGYIKFKYDGPSGERKLWYVYLNGFVVGSIDQGDSFWNKVHVCAENTIVRIQKLGRNMIEFPYSLRPGDLTEIGVGDYLFDPAIATSKKDRQ